MAGELVLFLKQMLSNPRHVGAVIPSSSALAQSMVVNLGPQTRRVIELGAGTGQITRAILSAGVPDENLVAVEMNPVFCTALQTAHPGMRVVNGLAQDLTRLETGPVDAILSSLPMLNISADVQDQIISTAFDLLGPKGIFVQFTYGLKPPIAPDIRDKHRLGWTKRPVVWANIPPAQVYVFSRAASH